MEGLKGCDTVTVAHCDNFDEPCKFLSKDFDLVNYQFIKNRMTQNTGFLVVGVIGKQSVGKSFILNMLANNFDKNLRNDKPFQTASNIDLIKVSQKTSGIDIHVTSDRVILLDAQPILTLNHLGVSMEKEKKIKVYSNEDTDSEGRLKMTTSPEILAVKLITYFMSVCHVVLIVDEHLLNYRLLRLVDLAFRLKPWIPCNPSHLPLEEPRNNIVHTEHHDEFHDYVAQVMFVENMCPDTALTSEQTAKYTDSIEAVMVAYHARVTEQKLLHTWLNEMRTKERLKYNRRLKQAKLQQQREKLLNDSSAVLQLETAKIEDGSTDECDTKEVDGDEVDDIHVAATTNDDVYDGDAEHLLHTCIQRPLRLHRVPILYDKGADRIGEEASLLQRAVFSCPRKHFCVTQNERFSELCWLEYASEMWHNTRESQLIVDFYHSYSNIVANDV